MGGKTKILIAKDDGYMEIRVEGHNADPIVCAGISAIIQTCELGLKALTNSVEGVELIEYENYFED